MEFVKEYFFYKLNSKDVDDISVKASSDCLDRYIHSFGFRLILNVKIIDERDNKTKSKVFKYTSFGSILVLCRMRKMRYEVIKII